MPSLDPATYTVAWIAPLEIEARAALCLFDRIHDGNIPLARGSDYVFTAGTICGHNVVLATLPPGQPYGTGSAGALVGQVKLLFPNLWFGLLVGVAAGLPKHCQFRQRDIRLGDILVALPEGESAGLVAYDLGKEVGEDAIQLLHDGHVLAKTETVVRSAIGKIKLRAPHDADVILPYYQQIQHQTHATGTFDDPGQEKDVLHDFDKIVCRPSRPAEQRTRIWYGPIGSGEKLVRDATIRNKLRDQHGIIGLEMEAAGTMNTIPVGVIRGVCDYADSHKNKDWQPYAAAMAASYAKAILSIIQPRVASGHFMVPLGRNGGFVGRTAVLERLLSQILPSAVPDSCQMTVVEGLGGVGKTQIALEAAYRMHEEHPECSIFWVTAITTATFENSYRNIGHTLGIEGIDANGTELKSLVKAALDRMLGSWLLIVDNADDAQTLFAEKGLKEFLPDSRKGSILFTTRNHHVTVDLDVLPVDTIVVTEMTRDEAVDLFCKHLNADQVKDATSTSELLDLLMGFPLAIRQASAYMAKTRISAARYLDHCKSSDQRLVQLLGKEVSDRHRCIPAQSSVATTWLISFQHISRDDALAAKYLGFMSFLSEKEIPRSVLPGTDDDLESDEAIGRLVAYGFITKRPCDESYDMHRLVGLAMRNWIRETGQLETYHKEMMQRLNEVYPFPSFANRNVRQPYLPHVQRALSFLDPSHSPDAASTCTILSKLWRNLFENGILHEAEALLRKELDIRYKNFGMWPVDHAQGELDLAYVLGYQGKFSEAEVMARVGLQRMESIGGSETPLGIDLSTFHDHIRNNQGMHAASEAAGRRTLELSTKVLGPRHRTSLLASQRLGDSLAGQGKFVEAEALYRRTMDLCIETFGEQDLNTLMAITPLACVLQKQQKLEEAEPLFRRGLYLSSIMYGKSHPRTMESTFTLASLLYDRGTYDEAEHLLRESLELNTSIFGIHHRYILETMRVLGLVLCGQRARHKINEAENLLRRVFDLQRSTLGPRHNDTIGTLHHLAYAAHISGRSDEAEGLYRQLIDEHLDQLGRYHYITLQSIRTFAGMLDEQGKHEKAEAMRRKNLAGMLALEEKYDEADAMWCMDDET